ncbi:MAG: hypothetical protein J6Z30_02530, partial [Pyramidobacter sp.]|nr:hypothetical protein [Pyramidobacter sp.]
MDKALLYVHGMGGSAAEAEQFAPFFPGRGCRGVEYGEPTPWSAPPVIRAAFEELRAQYGSVMLLANSVGAYLSMLARADLPVEKALFVSPLLDM